MEHRQFLAHPEAHRPFAGGNLLERIGGHATIAALIDGLYHRIETDPVVRPLFSRRDSTLIATRLRSRCNAGLGPQPLDVRVDGDDRHAR